MTEITLNSQFAETPNEAFVLRVWKPKTSEVWQCYLVHVATGEVIPCGDIAQISLAVEKWVGGQSTALPGQLK